MNALILVVIVVSSPLPKEPAQKPRSVPIGTWRCTSAVDGDRSYTAIVEAGLVFEFTADGKIHVVKGGKPDSEGRYTADPTRSPAEIDMVLEERGATARGIFKVEKDVLTVCFDYGNPDKRPKEFAAPAGSTLILVTFQRTERK